MSVCTCVCAFEDIVWIYVSLQAGVCSAIQVLSVFRLPLGLCRESDRNPGRLPGLSTQLSTCHIFIFKGSKIDRPPSYPSHTPCEPHTAW